MPLRLLCLVQLVQSASHLIYSLRHDRENGVQQVLDRHCSSLRPSTFLCAGQVFLHLEFDLDLSLARFQSHPARCAIVVKLHPMSYYDQDSSGLEQRTVLTVDVSLSDLSAKVSIDAKAEHWNDSSTVLIVNDLEKNNYCSFDLSPIGSHCTYIRSLQPRNVSCYVNVTRSHDHPSLALDGIPRVIQSEPNSNRFTRDLLEFLVGMSAATLLPCLFFLGHLVHLERRRIDRSTE